MSLNHLLLGLTREGATGYQIKQDFQDGLRHIWDAELSQIYPALQRLEDRGLLTSGKSLGDRGAAKRVYRLSAAGEEELSRWLGSDPVLHDERHPFLAQLFLLGDLADWPQTLKYLRELESVALARLRTLEHLADKWRRAAPDYPELADPRGFHAQLTLEFGLSNARAMHQCCTACIDRVMARLSQHPTTSPST